MPPLKNGKKSAVSTIGAQTAASTAKTVAAPSAFPINLTTSKPFLYAYTLSAGEPLPQSPIEPIQLKEAFLSDVLLKLLSGLDYKLSIDPEVNDRTLNDVNLSGTFASAMNELGNQGGFFVRLEDGKVLNILRRGTVDVPLPPLGYFSSYQQQNPSSNAAAFNRSTDYYTSLEQALKNSGIDSVERRQTPASLRLSISSSQLSSLNYTLDSLRAQKPTLALRVRYYSVPEKLNLGALMGIGGGGDVLQGDFDNASLNKAFQSRNVRSVLVESGLVLAPISDTITFSAGVNSATEGCGGGLPGALLTSLNAEAINDGVTLNATVDVVRITAPAVKCQLPSPLPTVNKTFSTALSQTQNTLLTGIPLGGGRQLIVLLENAKLIGFAAVQPPYAADTPQQPAPTAAPETPVVTEPKKTDSVKPEKPNKKSKKISAKPVKKAAKAATVSRKVSASNVGVIVNPDDGLSGVSSDTLPETSSY
ncbi:MAG: hypothetical protein LW855_00705 [Alphaproteobacteria bacterium]|nr:hypothetical protein [Alphaproteobacteria bacterium]